MFSLFLQRSFSDLPVNYALRFNGNGILSLGRFNELNNLEKITIQFWMYPDEWKPGAHIIEKGDALHLNLAEENSLDLQIGNRKFIINQTNIETKKWSHITIMNGNEKLQIYVNNKLIHTFESFQVLPEEKLPLYIGEGFKGRIDELRIYNNTLSGEYNYFWQNTLNDLNPQWYDLIGYYKFDQFTCPNIVDYTRKNNGTMSKTGVTREIVTDNDNFKYIMTASYINFRRFGWANLDMKKFQLLNTLNVVSGKTDAQGNAWIDFYPNNAEFSNAEYVSKFENRRGVAHFGGNGASMNSGIHPIENGVFTFGTWIYVEDWIENSTIVQKFLDENHGFYVKLGSATDKIVLLHIGGKDYILKNKLPQGEWVFFAFSVDKTAECALEQAKFVVNDWHGYADEGPEGSADEKICDFSSLSNVNVIMGENFKGYLDDTAVLQIAFNFTLLENLKDGLQIPDFDKYIPKDIILEGYDSYWRYDNPHNLGLNTLSWKEQLKTIVKPYEGRRGFRVFLSWTQHDTWQETIKNDELREKLAQNMANVVNSNDEFSGTDVDFEFPFDGLEHDWTYYNKFLKIFREKVDKKKNITITHHAQDFQVDKDCMQYFDAILLQCYGPRFISLYTYDEYVKIFNRLKDYGYPTEKVVMSYGTTTTWGFLNGEHKPEYPPETQIKALMNDQWTGKTNHSSKDGYEFYFNSYDDVFLRAQHVRDVNAGGFMYWDTISDVRSDHKYSFAKVSSFALEGNVDLIVDKVENAPPVPTPYPNPDNDNDKLMIIIISCAVGGGIIVLIVIGFVTYNMMTKKRRLSNTLSMNTLLTQ